MGKLVVQAFVTLDGVMQAPGGPEEDRDGGFEHGGWLAPFVDDEFMAFVERHMRPAAGFLLGRRTYEIFAGYWPAQTDPGDPIASVLNRQPKYVVSRTLQRADWPTSTLVRGDVVKEIARIKEHTPGELQVHGSTGLLRTLNATDLVDEVRLAVAPIVLGKGKPLYAAGAAPAAFEAVESGTTRAGLRLSVLRRAGRPRYGTVGA